MNKTERPKSQMEKAKRNENPSGKPLIFILLALPMVLNRNNRSFSVLSGLYRLQSTRMYWHFIDGIDPAKCHVIQYEVIFTATCNATATSCK